MGWLSSLTKPKRRTTQTLRLGHEARQCVAVPGQKFPWPRGTTLIPAEDIEIAVSDAILDEGGPIGRFIDTSHPSTARITTSRRAGGRGVIAFKVKAGGAVTTRRTCQAVILSDDPKPKTLHVILPTW